MSLFTLRRVPLIAALLALILAAHTQRGEAQAAKPYLHPLFTDHMVFQRGIKAPVWGWTTPGKTVTVSMDGKSASATAGSDGKWMAPLGPFKAGGPYTLTITGPETTKVEDVLIGDVWICSGQSNMEMGIGNVNNAQDEIAKADNPHIRLFTVPKQVAAEPQETVATHWETCTPENIKHGVWNGFSAVGYFFGKHLEETEHVPIGLIHTSWGGTIAEAWASASALRTMPDFGPQVDAIEKVASTHSPMAQNNPNITTVLYNGMIAPLLPYGIKGAIWYQGESNAGRGMQYRTLLPTMIKDWRARFTGGEFPFFIVQLASFTPVVDQPIQEGWADLREAQLLTSENLPKTGIAVALDIGDAADIHPKNKQEVGRRLGLSADAIAYGKKVEYSGPLYKSMKVEGNKIRLTFSHLGGGLATKDGGPLKGFAIAGAGGHFEFADAAIEGDTIVVSSSKVPNPTAVRYAWANNPICNLVNKAGLPASSFRTDMPVK